MYIDAHCHLQDEQLLPDYIQHIETFIAAKGRGIVIVGCDYTGSFGACQIARRMREYQQHQDGIFDPAHISCPDEDVHIAATIGLHPSEACFGAVTADNMEIKIAALRGLLMEQRDVTVAIGECGIDMHYEGSIEALGVQKELFARQCSWAQEEGLPLVVHSRDGYMETVEVMRQYPDVVYYVHCFGYGVEEVMSLLEEFPMVYFGFDGNITYPKAEHLRDACRAVPVDRLILETDSPYLAPQGLRGSINVPANVVKVYEYVAALREVDIEELSEQVTKNVTKMYGR